MTRENYDPQKEAGMGWIGNERVIWTGHLLMKKTRLYVAYVNHTHTHKKVPAGQHYGESSSYLFRKISKSGCLSEMSVPEST